MSWITKHLGLFVPPGLPVVPSFAQQSSPDYTWTVAGLQISAHSHGLPWGMTNYITVAHGGQESIPAVPEASSTGMLLMGLAVVACLRRKGLCAMTPNVGAKLETTAPKE